MKIIAFSDTHRKHRGITLPEGDVACFAGDGDFRKHEDTIDFCNWFLDQPVKKRIVVAGNHDFFPYKDVEEFRNIMLHHGIIYLQDEGIEIDGVKFWGTPWSTEFYNWAFMKSEAQLRALWPSIPTGTDVVITHQPVWGIGDISIYGNEHIGDKNLLAEMIERVKPKIHIYGHNHSGYGVVDFHGVKFCNATQLDDKYEPVNKPLEFDI